MNNWCSSVSSKLTRYVHYRLFLHQADNPATSFILNDASFVPLSCLTHESATTVAQSVNGITWFVFSCEPYHAYRGCVAYVQESYCFCVFPETRDVTHIDWRRHVYINATAQVLPQSDSTSEHMTIGSVVNVSKQTKKGIFSNEKREQINAKRRATNQKKKDEEGEKLQHEYQPSLTMSGMIVWFLTNPKNN